MSEVSSITTLQFDEQGLLPCVVQDWLDGTVLMVGFMNQQAWEMTCDSQRVHFWSRSRKRLWKKGETSGHELLVKEMFVDCDRDTILVKAQPIGPTCHTGTRSCFFLLYLLRLLKSQPLSSPVRPGEVFPGAYMKWLAIGRPTRTLIPMCPN